MQQADLSRVFIAEPSDCDMQLPGFNLIGNRGACILAEQLPRLPNLRRVSLSGNRIGQIGMDALVAAKRRSERSTCMRDPNPASIARCYVTQ